MTESRHFTMPIQAGDVVSTGDDGLARVLSVGRSSHGDVAWLRRYGGDRATLGSVDVSTLGRTALVTFALDDHDMARLRELRRLHVACGKIAPDMWGPPAGALALYLRWTVNLFCELWRDDPRTWTEALYEGISEARSVAPLGKRKPLRVRVPLSLRDDITDVSDSTRQSSDAIARAAVVHQLEVIYGDAPLSEADMIPERRLCVLPPRAAKNAVWMVTPSGDGEEQAAVVEPAEEKPPEPPRVRIAVGGPAVDAAAFREVLAEFEGEATDPPLRMEAGTE